MSRLIETIHIKKRKLLNLSYHNDRLNRSRRVLFGSVKDLNLENYVHAPNNLSDESIKCRVLYAANIERIEFLQYHPKSISSLLLLEDVDISYGHKFEDRSSLNDLYAKRRNCDDILISKKGLVTDTYYCNVAFLNGDKWITPKSPLLKGVQRQSLIDLGRLITDDIQVKDLNNYQSVRLFNSMLGFGQIELPINAIKIIE